MSKFDLQDTFVLDGVRKTSDGYITAFVRAGRTGVQLYRGAELGRPDLDVVRVYRPPEEVFSKDAMRSFAHRPVTLRHPPKPVNAKNWKQYAGGQTGEDVVRDGEFVRVPMVMMDEGLVDAYEKHGVDQLSWGYSCDIQWRQGIVDAGQDVGQHYDAVQTAIRANHLAVVPVARGGDQLRIGDRDFSSEKRAALAEKGHAMPDGSYPIENRNDLENAIRAVGRADNPAAVKAHIKKRAKALGAEDTLPADWVKDASGDDTCPECGAQMHDGKCPECGYTTDEGELKMKVIVIDGLNVSVADDQSASIVQRHIDSLLAKLKDADTEMENLKKKKQETEEACDAATKLVQTKDGEIAVLKKQVTDAEVTPAKLDALVKDRLAVIDGAAKLLPKEFAYDGKTITDIRKAAVEAKLGDGAKGMSDGAIEGAFAALTAGAKDDGGSRQIADSLRSRAGGSNLNDRKVIDDAHKGYVEDLSNAWKKPTAA